MPIEFLCQSCSKTLRVAEKYAGKKAKCPKCTTVNIVPDYTELDESVAYESLPSVEANMPPGSNLPSTPLQQNPYAVSPATSATNYQTPRSSFGGGSSGALGIYRPLHDATFYLGFLAWGNIIMGGFFCLTIVGIIHGAIFLWLGITLKGANDGIKNAFQSGDSRQLHTASKNLATYFKINGVLMMIGLGFAVLYILLLIVLAIVGLAAGASSSGGF